MQKTYPENATVLFRWECTCLLYTSYSSPLRLEESFAAMAQLAADPAVGRIECRNLLATDGACVEWHATYRDRDGDEWQLDMIHIVRDSRYDGYFERVADRIAAALTPVTRRAILQLKYDTPDDVKIAGIEYYVPTLVYLPYCFFNIISPLMSITVAAIGYKIARRS